MAGLIILGILFHLTPGFIYLLAQELDNEGEDSIKKWTGGIFHRDACGDCYGFQYFSFLSLFSGSVIVPILILFLLLKTLGSIIVKKVAKSIKRARRKKELRKQLDVLNNRLTYISIDSSDYSYLIERIEKIESQL